MTDSSPLLREEPDARRSIQNRFMHIFRSNSNSRSISGDESGDSGILGLGITNSREPGVRTRLLESYDRSIPVCGERRCSHGTFSPRPGSAGRQTRTGSSNGRLGQDRTEGAGAAPKNSHDGDDAPGSRSDSEYTSQMKLSLSAFSMNENKKLYVGFRMHPQRRRLTGTCRYISYYIPFFNWIRQYRWSFVRGDLVAALTVSSIYIPMALSLASNLAHGPPVNGLYSFVIHPFIYAILGSCPLLVIGPEAAGSLLTGAIVKASVRDGHSGEDDLVQNAIVIGVATAMAGTMILVAGLTRLGFLDNVLSRPFLRGFVTAIGFVIFVDQLVSELGLAALAKDAGVSHGTTVAKLAFIVRNIRECHLLTSLVSLVSFSIIMLCRCV